MCLYLKPKRRILTRMRTDQHRSSLLHLYMRLLGSTKYDAFISFGMQENGDLIWWATNPGSQSLSSLSLRIISSFVAWIGSSEPVSPSASGVCSSKHIFLKGRAQDLIIDPPQSISIEPKALLHLECMIGMIHRNGSLCRLFRRRHCGHKAIIRTGSKMGPSKKNEHTRKLQTENCSVSRSLGHPLWVERF